MNPTGISTHLSRTLARIEEIERKFADEKSAGTGVSFSGFVQQAFGNVPSGTVALPPEEIDTLINNAAEQYQLRPSLLRAVVKAESGFNTQAVSPAGALGLMQLMPATANALGVTDPFDPAQNIQGGARYLREQLDHFGGDESRALAAYNAGPGAVERYGGIPPYAETQGYVQRVLSLSRAYDRGE